MNTTRRSILKTTAWTTPAVMVAAAAPAFATSGPPVCEATGWYREPGEGQATKDYYVRLDCTGPEVQSVSIFDDADDEWRPAVHLGGDLWAAYGFNDSRRHRLVLINGNEMITVSFPPWNG